jgi:hypothetical protein
MIKRLAWIPVLLAVFWTGGIRGAEASCAGSTIWLGVPDALVANAIPVFWRIDPPCDVIESGLLLGSQSTLLTPIGQRIYGQQAGYQQEVPVAETGE